MIQNKRFSIAETLGVLGAVVGDSAEQSWGTLYVMLKKLEFIF